MSQHESNSDGCFHAPEEILEDGSRVFGVYFNGVLVADVPSEKTAIEMSAALNTIRELFLAAGNDRYVVRLACSFDAWMARFDQAEAETT